MKAVVINNGKAEYKEVENNLQGYYREIGCDIITITYRQINGKEFCIICDDEGLFKSPLVVTAVDAAGHPALVGGLIICSAEGGEDFEGIEREDALRILSAISYTVQHDNITPVVVLD